MSQSNHYKFYSILALCSLVFVLLSGEILARIFVHANKIPPIPPKSTIDPYKMNPYMVGMRPFLHFHIPGSKYVQSRSYYSVDYNINSSGFRGPEIQPKKKELKRMIVVGDSIVEGHGCPYSKTFSSLLDKKARQYNWEVLNLGVQGASPIYFAANLPRYFSSKPDAVLVVMFENDLYDDRIQERSYFSKPLLDNPESLFINAPKTDSFLSKSQLHLLLGRAFNRIKYNPLDSIIKLNCAIDISNGEQKKLDKMSPWLVAPSMFDKQWSMSEKYLDFAVSKLRGKKIPVYFVFLSLGALGPGLDESYRLHAETMDKKIAQWSALNQIPFLSLVPLIQSSLKTNRPEDLMIKDDGHPTPKTHAIIANQIWGWIMNQPQK